MQNDLLDRLVTMYSHRGDGIPTQLVNPDGEEAATEIRRLRGLVEELARCVVEAAIPLEAMILAGRPASMSDEMWYGVVNAAQVARVAISRLEPQIEGLHG